MSLLRALEYLFKLLIDAIDSFLSLFVDDEQQRMHSRRRRACSNASSSAAASVSALDSSSASTSASASSVSISSSSVLSSAAAAFAHVASSTVVGNSIKKHNSGNNLAALEALPPHHQNQRLASIQNQHHHNPYHSQQQQSTAILQSVSHHNNHHPPYPTYHQRPVLFHRKKSEEHAQHNNNTTTKELEVDNPTTSVQPTMLDQSTFFSLDDQQYQVWKQLNHNNAAPISAQLVNASHNDTILIDMDKLQLHQNQKGTATNLQQNTTNAHRRGSKSYFANIGGALGSPSPVNRPAVSPDVPIKRKQLHSPPSPIANSSNHLNSTFIDTVPSMLQKQTSDENQTTRNNATQKRLVNAKVVDNNSNIATINRGIRGSEPLVRLNRLSLLEAKSPPISPLDNNNSRARDRTSSPIHSDESVSLTRMSLLLPIIPYDQLEGIDEKKNRIGGGAFGQVFRGFWKGTPVAVKFLSGIDDTAAHYHDAESEHGCMPAKVISAFEEEVSILSRLRHPNICLLLGVCAEPYRKAIVTELVSRGSLWDALRQKQHFQRQQHDPFFWPLSIVRKVLEGAGRGLAYLHSHSPPIIHRDLKSANILLDESFNVKICDFGLAKLRDITTVLTANVGTVQWMAPEVLIGNAYDESVDVYSMALVCWEMLTGKCPYEGMKQVEVALAVINHQSRPPIPQLCSIEQKIFLQTCWSTKPQERLTAESFIRDANRFFR